MQQTFALPLWPGSNLSYARPAQRPHDHIRRIDAYHDKGIGEVVNSDSVVHSCRWVVAGYRYNEVVVVAAAHAGSSYLEGHPERPRLSSDVREYHDHVG